MKTTSILGDFVREALNDLSKKRNAEQLEVYCSANQIRSLKIVNNEILESKRVIDSGIGVRVLKDGFVGYASRTSLTLEGAKEAYTRAAGIANSKVGEREEKVTFAHPQSVKGSAPPEAPFLDHKLRSLQGEELAELGKTMLDSALGLDKRVADCSGSINIVSYEFAVSNSNGIDSQDEGDYAYATLTSIAKEGEQSAQGFDTLVTRRYAKLVSGVGEVGSNAADTSVRSLGARQPSSGKCDIIYTPSCLSITMLNLGRMANAQRVQDGQSMFVDSLGKSVASDTVSIVEDGRYEDGMRSTLVDDEGLPTKRTVIIENGTLKSFFFDSHSGAKSGVQSTGNGFRIATQVGGSTLEGKRYDYPPTCSSANFVVLPGDTTEEKLIQDTKRGILLGWTRYERILNSRTGAFTVNARGRNFMIENGEIKYPVYGFRIHDNYMNVLKSIDCVAKNVEQKGHWGLASIAPSFRTRGIQIISM